MLADFSVGVHVLCLDGLVDKDLEGGKVMKVKLTAEPSVESSAEPLLLLGVGGDIIKCITGQPVELTAVLVDSPSSLREVAEPSRLRSIRPLGMWCSRNVVQNSFHVVSGPAERMLR